MKIFSVSTFLLVAMMACFIPLNAQRTIRIAPDGKNDILMIKNAIERAKKA